MTKLQATREMWFMARMRLAMVKKPSAEHSKLYGYQGLRDLGGSKKKKKISTRLSGEWMVKYSYVCNLYFIIRLL